MFVMDREAEDLYNAIRNSLSRTRKSGRLGYFWNCLDEIVLYSRYCAERREG